MNRLLKKEIKVVPVKVLNMHYCRILERGETMDAKDIPVADAKEVLWVENELHQRLIRAVGHDFYPSDRVEEKYPSNYMVSILNPTKPKAEPGIKIKFKIIVTSSIGSKIAEKTIHVDSRYEADLLANKLIRDLGLKKATYKIS